MGKGGRSHSSRYRIVVHSAEYYKKQRELKALRQRQKDMRDGNIFSGEMMRLPIVPAVLDLLNEVSKKKGVKSD